jgi:hypothetical protein
VALSAPSAIGADGGRMTAAVTTQPECAWTASTPTGWISELAPTSGQGSGEIAFRVAENERPIAREGELVVNDERLRITQQAAPCRIDLNPREQTVDDDGGSGTVQVDVRDGCEWAAQVEGSWLRITGGSSGSGDGRVTFVAERNPGDRRAGAIIVGDARAIIRQAARSGSPGDPTPPSPACTYTIAPASVSLSAAGGGGSVSVSAGGGCTWTADSAASWITVTSGSTGSGNGSVGYLVLPNTGGERTGSIAIAGRSFVVTQAALVASTPPPSPACVYAISPTSREVGPSGGTGTVSVSTASGCAWSATSNNGWIAVTSGGSGAGNGSVGYSVRDFNGNERQGSLTIAGESFTIVQQRDDDDDDD